MKNILNRIHTRWLRRRLQLAQADLRWMERDFPRQIARRQARVEALSRSLTVAGVHVSAADMARAVTMRAKREVLS